MTRLLVLVEGYSEEKFVKTILAPHLEFIGVYASATVVETQREINGKKHAPLA